MRDFNVNRQFERLELFFEECRQQRQEREEHRGARPFVPRLRE